MQWSAMAWECSLLSDVPEAGLRWQPEPVPAPRWLAFHEALADELGLDQSPEALLICAGNQRLSADTAMVHLYAGHQFGHFNPSLGDGRALLLGEWVDAQGQRWDFQLKGSGRTPCSRQGDGRATVRSMLREYLISHAMHGLGIPTTRALAVVATGNLVQRDRIEPGAILLRLSHGLLRIGSLEYQAARSRPAVVQKLMRYVAERRGWFDEADDLPALFLRMMQEHAMRVAQWMAVGFIHGVLNTDNISLMGETMDYGPCAFLEHYDPSSVFSSIDRSGRYAYDQQPAVMAWNMGCLARALAVATGTTMEPWYEMRSSWTTMYRDAWQVCMRAKLGLTTAMEGDERLIEDYLLLLQQASVDWTLGWRYLAESLHQTNMTHAQLFGSRCAELEQWLERWRQRCRAEAGMASTIVTTMQQNNPARIPRNHHVEQVLLQAEHGETEPFFSLFRALTQPYVEDAEAIRWQQPADRSFTEQYMTFCGT